MDWQIVEHDGHPAVTMGWENDWSKPMMVRSLWVNQKEKWDEEYYSRFYGGRLLEGNHFLFGNRATSNYSKLDTTGWVFVHETKPIKAPGRGGKNWSWEWRDGKWERS